MHCSRHLFNGLIIATFLGASWVSLAIAATPKQPNELCVTYAVDKKTGKQVCVNTIEPGNLPLDGKVEAIVLPELRPQSKLVWANEIHSGPLTQRTHEYLQPKETLANWKSMVTTQHTFGPGVNTLSGMKTHLQQAAQDSQAYFKVIQDTPDWLLTATYNPKLNVEFFYSATQSSGGLYALLYETKTALTDAERNAVVGTYFQAKPAIK
jgi:hypothetical protein